MNKKIMMISAAAFLSFCVFLILAVEPYISQIPAVDANINYYLNRQSFNTIEQQNVENYLSNLPAESFKDKNIELSRKYLAYLSEISLQAKNGQIAKKYLVALSKEYAGKITKSEDFQIAEKYYSSMLGKPVEIKGSFSVGEDDSILIGTSIIPKTELQNLALRLDIAKIIIEADGKVDFESETETFAASNADIAVPKEKGAYIFTGKDNEPAVVSIADRTYTGDEIFITENTMKVTNKRRDIFNTFSLNGHDFTTTSNPNADELSEILVNRNDNSVAFTNTKFSTSDGKLRNYDLIAGQPEEVIGSTYHEVKFMSNSDVVVQVSAAKDYTFPKIYYDGNMVINEDDELKVVFSKNDYPLEDHMVLVNTETGHPTANGKFELIEKEGSILGNLKRGITTRVTDVKYVTGSIAGIVVDVKEDKAIAEANEVYSYRQNPDGSLIMVTSKGPLTSSSKAVGKARQTLDYDQLIIRYYDVNSNLLWTNTLYKDGSISQYNNIEKKSINVIGPPVNPEDFDFDLLKASFKGELNGFNKMKETIFTN